MSQIRSKDKYNPFYKIIHWVTASIIFGLLALGFFMHALAYSPFKLELYNWHKSFGLLVLGLLALRLVWRLIKPLPRPLDSHTRAERFAAKTVHIGFYILLLALPLSGWVMSSAGDYPVAFFGIEVPDLTDKDKALYALSKEAHEIMAFTMIALILLHVAGAVKHHAIDRDITLRRMASASKAWLNAFVVALLVLGGFAIGLSYALPKLQGGPLMIGVSGQPASETAAIDSQRAEQQKAQQPLQAPLWQVNEEDSHIDFTVRQNGQSFAGTFQSFEAEIWFDAENLPASSADVSIDISSLTTGSEDRDSQALSSQWFFARKYPQARFQADVIRQVGADQYEAEGMLTIRGVTQPVVLPFTLRLDESDDGTTLANMTASMDLSRLAFGIGQGEWQNTEVIGDMVAVDIRIEATCCVP